MNRNCLRNHSKSTILNTRRADSSNGSADNQHSRRLGYAANKTANFEHEEQR